MKFGQLTVQKLVEYRTTSSKRNIPIVECLCDCGQLHTASLWDIRTGKTKTCNVRANHLKIKDRTIPAFNHIYNHSYKGRAIKSGLDFEITRDQFKELSQKHCHYCGVPPTSTLSIKNRKSGKDVSSFTYNGLDRKNSSLGYTYDNVVTCCGTCNHAKHTMSYDDFIAWLDRVVGFRNKVQ